MSDWWYNIDEKEEGPVTQEELSELYEKNIINSKTLVWRKGFDSWKEINQIRELHNLLINEPPPIPTKDTVSTVYVNYPDAGPWRRFFARILDLWWQNILIQFLLSILLGLFSPGFISWIEKPGSAQVFAILTLPLALILDAFIQGIFGNALGKTLLGLKVIKNDGEKLALSDHISRNLSMWGSGLAFGIPLINLITLSIQHANVKKGKPASHDVSGPYFVKAKPIKWYRYLLFAILFFIVFVFMITLRAIEQQM